MQIFVNVIEVWTIYIEKIVQMSLDSQVPNKPCSLATRGLRALILGEIHYFKGITEVDFQIQNNWKIMDT